MKRLLFILVCMLSLQLGYAQEETLYFADTLKEVRIRAPWKNDTERYNYNQMKHYVTIVLPYVNACTQLFKEVQAKENNPSVSRREYKNFVSAKEDEMRNKFEDKIKNLNVTQGVLLVKLLARQTNLNLYHMITEVKNPIAAFKWQTWARLHGMNLDKNYNPDDEPMLENIMSDLGYPLPASYATR